MSIEILNGNALDVLRTLPDVSIQCCVTSPPYYGLRDYGAAGQIGLESTPEEYIARMVDVFREVRRVLRDDGTLWLNIGDSYARSNAKGGSGPGGKNVAAYGAAYTGSKGMGDAKPKDLLMIPAVLALALRADGWFLRSDIIWHKPNPMPESVRDRPTSAHEHVFLLTKSARYFYDAEAIAEPAEYAGEQLGIVRGQKRRADGMGRKPSGNEIPGADANIGATRNARNVWTITPKPYRGAHFATMPPSLAERCIKAGTSEKGQCQCCGAPWVRKVERSISMTSGSGRSGREPKGKHAGSAQATSGTYDIRMEPLVAFETTGWAPSCACPERAPEPQRVLDPFGGAGTTGLAASSLGRHATLIELNVEYCDLMRERLGIAGDIQNEIANLRRAIERNRESHDAD